MLRKSRVVVESDGFSQGVIDPPEHGEHDGNGLRGGFAGKTGGQCHA